MPMRTGANDAPPSPPPLAARSFYGEPIPGRVLCERLASYMHLFNLYWSMRCGGGGVLCFTGGSLL